MFNEVRTEIDQDDRRNILVRLTLKANDKRVYFSLRYPTPADTTRKMVNRFRAIADAALGCDTDTRYLDRLVAKSRISVGIVSMPTYQLALDEAMATAEAA